MQDSRHCEGPRKGGSGESSSAVVVTHSSLPGQKWIASLLDRSFVMPEYARNWLTVRVFSPERQDKHQLSEYSLAQLVLFPFHALQVHGSLLRISPVVSTWTALVLTLGAAVAFFSAAVSLQGEGAAISGGGRAEYYYLHEFLLPVHLGAVLVGVSGSVVGIAHHRPADCDGLPVTCS
mmetsp:Transcript_83245/g.222525  ORF Transcript_83245/g.222525 Transcript_83245/m.222525 type:complete len:178 (-) Transcript_83245:709-1242(-)